MKKLIRIIVISVLGLAAGWLLLFCRAPMADVPPGVVVVDYWEKWTDAEGRSLQEIVNDFNATVGKEKGIYVREVTTSAIEQKTLIATAAGVPPDIAGLYDANIVQYAAQNSLMPLEQLAADNGISAASYKKVYWDACNYNGHLYALISTPMNVALHYNTRIFRENAAALRAAGCDPTRPPQTLQELDAYAKVLDQIGPNGEIKRAGYLPLEPGWYINYSYIWFGGHIFDKASEKITLTDPGVVASYEWARTYSERLGTNQMKTFHSAASNFDSPENPFMIGTVAMEQQGPWMANFILTRKPSMSTVKMSHADEMKLPLADRLANYDWAVAPFPSAVPDYKNATYCGFDALTIPRGAQHPKEAFEFIAYVNSQPVMEKLCMAHCKNSPLANVSKNFLEHHPNPYINVFEDLSSSPNARGTPQMPIWTEVGDELSVAVESITQNLADPATVLAAAQVKLQAKYDLYLEKQRARAALAAQ